MIIILQTSAIISCAANGIGINGHYGLPDFQSVSRWDGFECISLLLPSNCVQQNIPLTDLLDSYTHSDVVQQVECLTCSQRAHMPSKHTFCKRLTIAKVCHSIKLIDFGHYLFKTVHDLRLPRICHCFILLCLVFKRVMLFYYFSVF